MEALHPPGTPPSRRISTLSSWSRSAAAPRVLLFVDQAIFSLANFTLTTVLARRYGAGEFGAYGVALAAALLVQLIQRNLYVISLLLMSERVALRTLPGLLAKHLTVTGGTVALLALATAAAVFAGTAGTAGTIADILVAMLSCAVVYFQADFDRAVMIKRGAFAGAVALSAGYLGIVASVALLSWWLGLGFRAFMLTLAGACAAKALWLALLRVRPRWDWGLRLLRRDWREYGEASLLSAVATAGYTNVPVMVLAATRGAVEVAGMTAMRSLTMPLNLALRSFDSLDKNRMRSLSGGTVAGARRVFWRTLLSYAALGAAALAVLALFPQPIVHLVYGNRYGGFTGLLLCWCLYCGLLGLMQPLQSMVMIQGRQKAFNRLSIVSGVVAAVFALATCRALGVWGAMTAVLLGAGLNVLLGAVVVREYIFGSHEQRLRQERRAKSEGQ